MVRTILHPCYADLLLQIITRDVSFILNLASDKSTDFTYYTKRFSLGLVYSSTFFVAFKVKNLQKTNDFMKKRIKDIINFTRVKNNIFTFLKEKINFC